MLPWPWMRFSLFGLSSSPPDITGRGWLWSNSSMPETMFDAPGLPAFLGAAACFGSTRSMDCICSDGGCG